MRALLVDEQEITLMLSEKLCEFFGVSSILFYNIQEELKGCAGVREQAYA